MKKQLLLGSALFAAISVFPQKGRVKPNYSHIYNMTERIASKFSTDNSTNVSTSSNNKPAVGPVQNIDNSGSQKSSASMPPSTINWRLLCGSANPNGMLLSSSKPLQYNSNVNAVSFIHRASASYSLQVPNVPAAAQTGVIVAEISSDWGNTFDSTCIWDNGTYTGRYPQGGVYSGAGNTDIANAYVIGTGPINTNGVSPWAGNFYASKKLAVAGSTLYNSTADQAPNAQQALLLGLPNYPANQGPHSWSRQGFTSTDDGVVRSLAFLETGSAITGVSVVKGTFNSGVFTWTTDSISPLTIMKTDGTNVLTGNIQMAWNKSGTTGYVVMMGAAATATGSNKGAFQPLVYKTTNSGNSWTYLTNGNSSVIDFNSPAMAPLLAGLGSVRTDPNLVIPWFDDFDIVVDANDKLHLAATIRFGISSDNDSLNYYAQYSIDGRDYFWPHVDGQRPYLYDFIIDGASAPIVVVVDSLSTEIANGTTGYSGFTENPWLPTVPGGTGPKIDIDTRIQCGRTPDGQYITFSFSESDTAFTLQQGSQIAAKYNILPNIKSRCMAIGSGANMYQVSPTEINVSLPTVGANPYVSNHATLHYMSPTTSSATILNAGGSFTADITTPFTVTNSLPLDPSLSNTTWYQKGKLSYAFSGTPVVTNINNTVSKEIGNCIIFPNPAINSTILNIDLKNSSSVNVTVLNTIGQVVKNTTTQGQVGENTINVDLSGLSSGVYFVNVKAGNIASTKKLIVQ